MNTNTDNNTSQKKEQFPPFANWCSSSNVPNKEAYDKLCTEAATDYEGFWARLAKENLDWHQPFNQILDESNAPFYTWFADGKLNASYNCLDRHVKAGNGNKVAIRFESDAGDTTLVSYSDLLRRVCKMANTLKSLNVKKGDRVIIYMSMGLESIAVMQACARIGAIHSVVFGGFSAKALHERIIDIGAKIVITADEQSRGGKNLPLKSTVDDALKLTNGEQVQTVLVHRNTGGYDKMQSGRDIWLKELYAKQLETCEPEWVEAEHPLFVLYTSGSTGTPKGVVHSTGGYMMWVTQTMKWTFDLRSSDVFWCTADIGWITGHSYVCYGPLSAGATQIVFEGIPTYPDASRFWRMIDQHACTIFHTAPTAIRSLIKISEMDDRTHPKNFNLSSLRLLGSVGEPINPEAWMWYYKNVGSSRCPILDTFWQTETGGNVIAPMPAAMALTPGSCCLPLPGIQAEIVDEQGQNVENGQGGLLVIKQPWPSMLRNVWGNPERYKNSYFPQELGGTYYLAGDGSIRDQQTSYFTITGRIDDVLSVSGHRLGTMEIESALVSHALVAEAAVVGKPDDVTGEAICVFVVLKRVLPTGNEAKQIALELRDWVRQEIGPIARPKEVRFADNLPKTRSGKIMRRLLRSIAKGEEITQDISTLENPAILEQLKESL